MKAEVIDEAMDFTPSLINVNQVNQRPRLGIPSTSRQALQSSPSREQPFNSFRARLTTKRVRNCPPKAKKRKKELAPETFSDSETDLINVIQPPRTSEPIRSKMIYSQ